MRTAGKQRGTKDRRKKLANHFAFSVALGQPSARLKKLPKFLSKPRPFRTALATLIVAA
jgi:hypothetical protein